MEQHEQFMEIALQQATQALSRGEFPVGCIIEYDGEVVARGVRSNSRNDVNEIDHAEILALKELISSDIHVDMARVTVYSTMEPCLMCYATLIVNGIRKIVYSYEDAMGGGTNLPLCELSPLYRDLEISITGNVLRKQGLDIFKKFFSGPGNTYLQGSLLAEYTLNQQEE